MYKYIIFILIAGALLYLAKDSLKYSIENFESSSKIDYIRILSKLSNKALQPYKGMIETSMTLNSKKGDEYYPQLWINENGNIKSAYNNKYLTISNDGTKVVLDVLDSKKKQTWNIDSNGYITIGDLALHLEGDNTSEDALVVVTKKGDGNGFQWYTESVSVNIETIVLSTDVQDGKLEKDLGDIIKSSSLNCTYSMWFHVNSFDYKKGEWKNIFNRGNKDTSDRGPSIWITPSEQRLHIRCDTSSSKNEGIDSSKFVFTLNQWYYLTFVFTEKELNFYVDGQFSEKYAFKGVPVHKGSFYQSLMGGFDGQMKSLEYINKAMTSDELIKRMKVTNPEEICKEDRVTTVIINNLLKSIDEWRTTNLDKMKKNEKCPPKNLGGNTVSFTIKTDGRLESDVDLLENQYYDLSVWVLSSSLKGMNIRPYIGSWSGEWKNVKKADTWKELQWNFLNTDRSKTISLEVNNSESSRHTLFLPVLSIKVLKVDSGNINVKEFRSNGTHPTCSIKDVSLNSIQGWCALKDKRDEYYIEADLDKLYQVQKIHTRGRGDYPQWTSEYRVEYFDIYHNKWRQYGGRLEGNQDMNTVKTNDVDILTDKIRIYPVSFQSWPSLRLSFSGSVGIKDKCNDYKVKSETLMNIVEREKYLKLYNRECKKISFYEYEMAIEKEKETLKSLQMKLDKAEIDAKTYQSKYKDTNDKLEELDRIQKNTESTKEIIESNNRTMSDKSLPSKVDDKCNPIQPSNTDSKSKTKTDSLAKPSTETKLKIENEGLTDHQILQKLLEGMEKINQDLSSKETKLVKIQSELDKLDKKKDDKEKDDKKKDPSKELTKDKKKSLEKKKKSTEQDIIDLKDQLKTCQANFSNSIPTVEHFASSPTVTKAASANVNVATCDMSPYDIRRHKQYNELIASIQKKMKSDYTCEKKNPCPRLDCPRCKPFNKMDITKHKDYPGIVDYIYELTKAQFSDITKHKDYKSLVNIIQKKTIQEYGRKTETGYIKCPNNCELISSINIENHPKFRNLLRAIVKRTIELYGEPIPDTHPVLYRRCSNGEKNNVRNNIGNMDSKKCVKQFGFEGFADVSTSLKNDRYTETDFDIRKHKQYPELINKIKNKYSTCDSDRDKLKKLQDESDSVTTQLKKLKEQTSVMEDVTQNDQYKKLMDAYKKCKVIESDITKHPNYKKTVDSLACTEDSNVSVIDITRHPEIDKYVLKSSLPIDLVKSKYESSDVKTLQTELDKLQDLHSKCVTRFDIDHFSGTPTVTSCSCNLATQSSRDKAARKEKEDKKEDKKEKKEEDKKEKKEDKKEDKKEKKEEKKEEKKISSVAQKMLDKLTSLTNEVHAKKEMTDDKKFFEIKKACNTALSFLKESNDSDVPFIESVYELIRSADSNGKIPIKKADEIIMSCLEKEIAKKTPAYYINEMLKKETTLAKNEKRLSNDMKEVEFCANNILEVSNKLTKLPPVVMANVQQSPNIEESTKMIKEFRSSMKDEMTKFNDQLKIIETKYDTIKKSVDSYDDDHKRIKDDIKILYQKFMDRAIVKWNREKQSRPSKLVSSVQPAPSEPVKSLKKEKNGVKVIGSELISEMRKLNNKVDGIDVKINQMKPITTEELMGYNNKYSVLY